MKKTICFFSALHLSFMLFAVEKSAAQGVGGDMLNEVPIWPVPAEMTIEEYKDANRRLSVGMTLMSLPFPGALHFYAGESKAGWKHVYAAGLGVTSIIVGAALVDEKDNQWEKTDLEPVLFTGEPVRNSCTWVPLECSLGGKTLTGDLPSHDTKEDTQWVKLKQLKLPSKSRISARASIARCVSKRVRIV